ncbi:MAG: hypothetical protein JJK56_08265 [Pseudomonas sp.]|uniref:hypothetical protein n=1 Tax=Pseudomonas sp. TaxID=306 RepID=UPI001A3923B4|nr:hypothetical protein [Pseudomonas sp.]MBL7227979.1 hypothetical protein [Pseudomonas sp.]
MNYSKNNPFKSFQQNSVEQTMLLLIAALEECVEVSASPECVTHLAKQCARIMTHHKRLAFAQLVSGANLSEVKPIKAVSYSNLLKTERYRVLLDEWMVKHTNLIEAAQQQALVRERKLKIKLLDVTNLNRYLENELKMLEADAEADQGGGVDSAATLVDELESAYRTIDSLINEFEPFIAVEEGGLIVNNSIGSKLVDRVDFYGYLRWKQGVIAGRRLKR